MIRMRSMRLLKFMTSRYPEAADYQNAFDQYRNKRLALNEL